MPPMGNVFMALICTRAKRQILPSYPSPDELWNLTFAEKNAWRDKFAEIPFEDKGGYFGARYYQHNAVEAVLEAIANNQERILLTLATGTGKTFIAFQLAWKLFYSRWNLSRELNGEQVTQASYFVFGRSQWAWRTKRLMHFQHFP